MQAKPFNKNLLQTVSLIAAININRTTVHTALSIPVKPMSDQKRTQLKIMLYDLKLIIVDEISMVSAKGLEWTNG